MNIDKFKNEHETILASVAELKGLVRSGIPENAFAIAKAIVDMSAAIKMHLASEDRFLYPMLAQSATLSVVRLGQKYQDDMGGIAFAYAEFASKWNTGPRVKSSPEEFRLDANTIFKALHNRIQQENLELYPLFEQGVV
ncbi:MAG: hemerythrin domain-containing protein [Pseudomonadota bacterium]